MRQFVYFLIWSGRKNGKAMADRYLRESVYLVVPLALVLVLYLRLVSETH